MGYAFNSILDQEEMRNEKLIILLLKKTHFIELVVWHFLKDYFIH